MRVMYLLCICIYFTSYTYSTIFQFLSILRHVYVYLHTFEHILCIPKHIQTYPIIFHIFNHLLCIAQPFGCSSIVEYISEKIRASCHRGSEGSKGSQASHWSQGVQGHNNMEVGVLQVYTKQAHNWFLGSVCSQARMIANMYTRESPQQAHNFVA